MIVIDDALCVGVDVRRRKWKKSVRCGWGEVITPWPAVGAVGRGDGYVINASPGAGSGRRAFVVVGGKRSRFGRRSARSGEGTEEEQAICNIRFRSPVQRDRGDGGE